MIVLGIDPGAESPGYAVWDSDAGRHIYVGYECLTLAVEVIVVESGYIGQMGLKAMWGLGFGAGWRLRDAQAWQQRAHGVAYGQECYTIRPDGKTGWRAALPPKPGCFQKFDGLPKDVIVARLRVRYQRSAIETTDDMIEAMGIAEAAAAILARPKASQRRALKKVEFK